MNQYNPTIIIRIGQNALSFAVADPSKEGGIAFEPYVLRSNMSLSANLREAFQKSPLLGRDIEQAQVIVDAPVLLVPSGEFEEKQAETLYQHTFAGEKTMGVEQTRIVHSELEKLNAVAIFKMNSDLRLVIGDHFTEVRYQHLMQAVWNHFYAQNFTGTQRKLFAYLHDKRLEIFCFDMGRFRFSNAYDVSNSRDAVYFLLAVWKQLGFDAQNDEIHLVFDTETVATADAQNDRETLMETLRRYVKNVHAPETSETSASNLPLDLKILFED